MGQERCDQDAEKTDENEKPAVEPRSRHDGSGGLDDPENAHGLDGDLGGHAARDLGEGLGGRTLRIGHHNRPALVSAFPHPGVDGPSPRTDARSRLRSQPPWPKIRCDRRVRATN